jgi:choline dehydrogenase-like flavoprotein
MSRIIVIGSGASGVHFAWAALQRGHQVVMLDVGTPPPAAVLPDAPFDQLAARLPDAAEYFLGERFQAALLPGNEREYYGMPPSKDYVFVAPKSTGDLRTTGFAPLFSFAQGGLAQAWTAGCYPFNDAELAPFPWGYAELGPHYDAIAQEIGITGQDDDTSRFFPLHENLLPGLELDEHARRLWNRYEQRRATLNRMGAYLGRSRVATLSRDHDQRRACWSCGRCLWGCPSDSLYTPALTLRRCQSHERFEYRGGLYVRHLQLDAHDRAEAVVATQVATGQREIVSGDAVVLAAGTLSSARIFLETLRLNRGEIVRLRGLMDNRQMLLPFVTLAMLGQPVHTDRYQYHQLMLALEQPEPADLVHCQITTLKSAAVHPIIQSIPLSLSWARRSFREIRAALGIANVNLADTRRDDNFVTLQAGRGGGPSPLEIHYAPPPDEPPRLRRILRRVRRCLWKLGAIAPAPMTHIRPMGASVHYAGTLPMSTQGDSLTTSPNCRSLDVPNLYLVDGSTFCSLPAKNLTFTLMANARRVAHVEF